MEEQFGFQPEDMGPEQESEGADDRHDSMNSLRSTDTDASSSSNDSIFEEAKDAVLPQHTIVILGQSGVGKSHLATWEVYKQRMEEGHVSETLREVMQLKPTATTAGFRLVEVGHDSIPEEDRLQEYEAEIDKASGFILMYDTMRRESYDLAKWLLTTITQRRAKPDWACLVVANGFNEPDAARPAVDAGEARDLCNSFGVSFLSVRDVCQDETPYVAQVLESLGGSHSVVGYLDKKGGGHSVLGRKNWKRRWFVLDNTCLTYRPTPDSPNVKGRIAAEDMESVRHGPAEKPQQFVLVAKKRELVMEAPSPHKRMMWVSKLTDVIQKQGRFQRSLMMSKRMSHSQTMQRFSKSSSALSSYAAPTKDV